VILVPNVKLLCSLEINLFNEISFSYVGYNMTEINDFIMSHWAVCIVIALYIFTPTTVAGVSVHLRLSVYDSVCLSVCLSAA